MNNRHYEPVRKDLVIPKVSINRRSGKILGTSVTATQEVRDWLKNQIKNHWFFYEQNGGLWIAFCNKNDAMMWKLAWH